jgi:hypothetical protein
MKITIKKIGLEPKDQLICFDKSFEIIDDLNHRYDWSFEDGTSWVNKLMLRKELIDQKYFGKEYWVKFISKSRIDGSPIFIIDTLNQDREDKISQIIN